MCGCVCVCDIIFGSPFSKADTLWRRQRMDDQRSLLRLLIHVLRFGKL